MFSWVKFLVEKPKKYVFETQTKAFLIFRPNSTLTLSACEKSEYL